MRRRLVVVLALQLGYVFVLGIPPGLSLPFAFRSTNL